VHLLLDGQPWYARIVTIGSYLTRKGCSLPADPIKVLLADDHTMFREGLAGILASYGGMEVVGSTPNGEEAVTLVERTRPDVVLMQVQTPFERAKDFLARMRAVSPLPKVVIVTMFESPRYLRELMNLGASAYLIKSASTQHLIGAIRAAVFDPQGENVVVGMPRGMLEEARKGSGGVLSARELEILLLAARGLSNREIGAKLHLAEATVRRHLANTYSKMEVSSRAEATRKAFQEEWITVSDVTDDFE
jgi:DNA-binding NarL/FixJ family response regulator